jgi:hypothetical protein
MESNKFQIASEPIDGAQIRVGGRTLVVPPVTLGYVRTNKDKLKALVRLKGATPEEQFDAFDELLPFIYAAVRRNYPNLSQDDLAEIADMGCFNDLMAAAMGQLETTLPVAQQGEVKPSA